MERIPKGLKEQIKDAVYEDGTIPLKKLEEYLLDVFTKEEKARGASYRPDGLVYQEEGTTGIWSIGGGRALTGIQGWVNYNIEMYRQMQDIPTDKKFLVPGTKFPDIKVSKDDKELDPSTYSFDQDGNVVLNDENADTKTA